MLTTWDYDSFLTMACLAAEIKDHIEVLTKDGYTVKGKMVENYPYQVGAFCTLLHNMGFVKADCFNDQYGAFQTIALERNMD